MTRTTLTLALGVLIGIATAQVLPSATAATGAAEIVTRDGVIVFMVNGQEQGRIDATGLHVNGDVSYSGASIDTVTYPFADRADSAAP
jgi:hypothetical protein